MLYNVPQFVDVEDKIVGPITGRQLIWMITMGLVLVILYNIFTLQAFFVIGIPVAAFFCAFAFWRPYGQPLTRMSFYGLIYLFRSRVYVWRQITHNKRSIVDGKKGIIPKGSMAVVSLEDIQNFSNVLDNPMKTLLENRKK